MNEEVEQEQSLGADGISESDQAASMAVRHLLNSRFIVYAQAASRETGSPAFSSC